MEWGEESVSSAIIALEMKIFRQKLASYELKLICNVDETRLFLNWCPGQLICIPKRIVHHPCTKGMSSKDRLIVLTCTNADGSLKASVAIVGNSKNPQCSPIKKPASYCVL